MGVLQGRWIFCPKNKDGCDGRQQRGQHEPDDEKPEDESNKPKRIRKRFKIVRGFGRRKSNQAAHNTTDQSTKPENKARKIIVDNRRPTTALEEFPGAFAGGHKIFVVGSHTNECIPVEKFDNVLDTTEKNLQNARAHVVTITRSTNHGAERSHDSDEQRTKTDRAKGGRARAFEGITSGVFRLSKKEPRSGDTSRSNMHNVDQNLRSPVKRDKKQECTTVPAAVGRKSFEECCSPKSSPHKLSKDKREAHEDCGRVLLNDRGRKGDGGLCKGDSVSNKVIIQRRQRGNQHPHNAQKHTSTGKSDKGRNRIENDRQHDGNLDDDSRVFLMMDNHAAANTMATTPHKTMTPVDLPTGTDVPTPSPGP
eukprot:GABV01000464.1.p1 GENE.GABV01000464.1~~GABV01000464.1.p1  ORF type:complete len:395 (-),score=64.91 GABV01000464.1:116-1213(-)